jgi:hypothetical protein
LINNRKSHSEKVRMVNNLKIKPSVATVGADPAGGPHMPWHSLALAQAARHICIFFYLKDILTIMME